MSTLHEYFSQLTPVRNARKKRPTFSPPNALQAAPRHECNSLPPNSAISPPEIDVATASLDFEEFSYMAADCQDMHNISAEHTTALLEFLGAKYGIYEMQISHPFLLLWCRHGIPLQDQRPFSIAGCIAVWLEEGDPLPGDIMIGDMGNGDDIAIDNALAADLWPYHMPKDETLLGIATQHFPDAVAISFISQYLIVEFAEESRESWYGRLEKLPTGFHDVGIALSYSNGNLITQELNRLGNPKPGVLANFEGDDSDYVANQGCFYPGAMLRAQSGDRISAGIAVEQDHQTRLTVAFHCWEQEYKTSPAKLGDPNHFSVIQGDTLVGHVETAVGTADIGLAKLKHDVVFSNRFLDIQTTAKTLLHSSQVNINDKFLIDGFTTGRQRLRCQGKRIRIEGETEVPQGKTKTSAKYITHRQGVYATGSPEIHGTPKIRAGICGAAVVRVKTTGQGGGDVLEKGEVSGFIQLGNGRQGNLLCFADAVDDLITAGWKVVPVAEKH